MLTINDSQRQQKPSMTACQEYMAFFAEVPYVLKATEYFVTYVLFIYLGYAGSLLLHMGFL